MRAKSYLITILSMLISTPAFADGVAAAAVKGKAKISVKTRNYPGGVEFLLGPLCFGCHGEDGTGSSSAIRSPSFKWERMAPSLLDSKIVKDPERTALVLLKGIKKADPAPVEYPYYMAGFANSWPDEDIANVITYLCSEFGGVNELTTAAQVAGWREKYAQVSGVDVVEKNGKNVLVGGLSREEIERVNNPVKETPAGERRLIEIAGKQVAFRWCPPSARHGFWMGSPAGEEHRDRDETRHQVVLTQGFWMMETEVTQGLWTAVTGKEPDYFSKTFPVPTKGDDYAVKEQSWEDCQEFISKVNAGGTVPEGLRAALPSEAQWEYACRAGTSTVFHFGDSLGSDQASIDGREPYGDAKKRPYRAKALPVRTFAANAWGLHDMHGGVWEWCADWYSPYVSGKQINPLGPKEGRYRVLRGGTWWSNAINCRSAYRGRLDPKDGSCKYGFRLTLQVDTAPTHDAR